MTSFVVNVDGEDQEVEPGTTGLDLFGKRRDIVAMTLNGKEVDLAAELPNGGVVSAITIGSPEGLAILRHSSAHVLAQAVQDVNPHADLGIGPPITDGF